MKRILLAIFVIASLASSAQVDPYLIFTTLPEKGTLLVRLTSNAGVTEAINKKNKSLEKQIQLLDTLRDKNERDQLQRAINNNLAQQRRIIANRDNRNAQIINAFSSRFTYCPVYYFYSDKSQLIAKKDFSKVLMDKDLNIVEPVRPLNNNYLIAEFSYIKQDTSSTWIYSEWGVQDGKAQLIDYYAGGNEKGPDALVLLLPDFQMPSNTFPQYVRTFERMPIIARSKERTIEKLQSKIESFVMIHKKENP